MDVSTAAGDAAFSYSRFLAGCDCYSTQDGTTGGVCRARCDPSVGVRASWTAEAMSQGLVFASDFECGNHAKAVRVDENEYDVHIRPDSLCPRYVIPDGCIERLMDISA